MENDRDYQGIDLGYYSTLVVAVSILDQKTKLRSFLYSISGKIHFPPICLHSPIITIHY